MPFVGVRLGMPGAPLGGAGKSQPAFLLDSLTAPASIAYSTRKLSSTYAGSAIRVQRSSDNTQQDIGFAANGQLDTVSLMSSVGAGEQGYIAKWYDQSGNGIDAVPISTVGVRIVFNGAVQTVNSNPAFFFDGVNPGIGFIVNNATIIPQPTTVAVATKAITFPSGAHITDGNGATRQLLSLNAGTSYQEFGGAASITGGTPDTTSHGLIGVYNNTGTIYVDGTSVISGTVGTNGYQTQLIGCGSGALLQINAYMGEYIVFASVISAGDIAKLHTSWQTQWGTP